MALEEEKEPTLKPIGEFTSSDICLHVFEGESDKGSHLYFSPTPNIQQNPNRKGSDVARLLFHIRDSEAIFDGVLVPTKYAGKNLGAEMIKYFSDYAERRGLDFFRTRTIHKPLIALALKRADFVPVSDNLLVEILPMSQTEKARIPNVQILRNEDGRPLVSGAGGGSEDFFRIVSHDKVLRKYPINVPENIVAIGTRYIKRSEVNRAIEYYKKRKKVA